MLFFVAFLLFCAAFAEPTHHPCDVMLENLRAKRQYHLTVFKFAINNANSLSVSSIKKVKEMESSMTAYEKLYAEHCIVPTSGFEDVFTKDNKIGK